MQTFVDLGVEMVTSRRTLTLARLELTLAAARDEELRAGLSRGRSTICARSAEALRTLGAQDAEAGMDRVAALLDGLALTALAHGPHDPAELAAWMRPPLDAMLRAQPGLGGAAAREPVSCTASTTAVTSTRLKEGP